MATRAHIVHRTGTRLRVKIPAKRGDPAWFAELRSLLAGHPEVATVTTNPVIGTALVVLNDARAGGIEDYLTAEAGLELTDEPPPLAQALSGVTQAMDVADNLIAQASAGGADLRTLAFLAFLTLALRQMLRGNILGPALPMIWYAFDLLRYQKPDPGLKTEPDAAMAPAIACD